MKEHEQLTKELALARVEAASLHVATLQPPIRDDLLFFDINSSMVAV